ncbi:MAG: hypothetical protein CMK99_23140 [Pseudomonas sp.]|nr:hypothetical protein [Pseudomonas sp.]HBS79260.1 hypothetical protein [Pseudomonas sp.]
MGVDQRFTQTIRCVQSTVQQKDIVAGFRVLFPVFAAKLKLTVVEHALSRSRADDNILIQGPKCD